MKVRMIDSKTLVTIGKMIVKPPFLYIRSPGNFTMPNSEKAMKSMPITTSRSPAIMKKRPNAGIAISEYYFNFFGEVSGEGFVSFGAAMRSFFFDSAGCGKFGFL